MAKVERRHREEALAAHGVLAAHFPAWEGWLANGGDVFRPGDGAEHYMGDEEASAQAIAEAEARGAARERARCVDIASREAGRRADTDAGDALFGLVAMLSNERCDEMMRDAYVGAAERAKGGENG